MHDQLNMWWFTNMMTKKVMALYKQQPVSLASLLSVLSAPMESENIETVTGCSFLLILSCVPCIKDLTNKNLEIHRWSECN